MFAGESCNCCCEPSSVDRVCNGGSIAGDAVAGFDEERGADM